MKESMHMPKKHKEHKELKTNKGLHHVGLDTVLPGKRTRDGMVSGKFGSLPKGKDCR